MVTRRTTPSVLPLSTPVSGSGWRRVTDGTPTSEVNGSLQPYQARGIYPSPGSYDAILRGEPIAATGYHRQARYVAGLDWRVEPPDDPTPDEEEQCRYVGAMLDRLPRGGLASLIRRVMSREAYGFAICELVYGIDEATGWWRLDDALSIMPWCLYRWLLDSSGQLLGVRIKDETGYHDLADDGKILVSIRDFMSRNWEGTSALRSLYYYCEAKRDLLSADAAVCERAGRGTLVMHYSPDASEAEIDAANQAAEDWQSGGQAWLGLPDSIRHEWDHGGEIPDPAGRVQIYDQTIARVWDDELSSLGQNKYGARAVGSEMRTSTERQLGGICEELANDLSEQLIRPIYRLNGWDESRACALVSSGFFDPDRLSVLKELCVATSPDGRPIVELTDRDRRALKRLFGLRG